MHTNLHLSIYLLAKWPNNNNRCATARVYLCGSKLYNSKNIGKATV